MNIEILSDQIRNEIVEGSNTLSSTSLRIKIDDVLKRNKDDSRLLQMGANELMTEFTKRFIKDWPHPPAWAFEEILEQLKPLKDIAAILNPKELNASVHVWENPCVMTDSRVSPEAFQKALWQRIFA
jgi:hypothetical protein